MEKHTYNLGIVGNCAFMAHINTSASVQWMCWPQFDSGAVFAGLIDNENGGDYSICPADENFQSRQYYIENTNILCTEFETPTGKFRVIDFAPRFYRSERYFKPLMLIRKIELLAGNPEVLVVCQPASTFLAENPHSLSGSNHIQFTGFLEEIRLSTNVPLTFIQNKRSFLLNENKYLVLTYGIPLETNLENTCEDYLKKTINYWRRWVKSMHVPNFHQKHIIRSALALKIHQFEDTGAIIAAGTTSLPEAPGSGRNWDYRFCWLRDAYYTLTAFSHIGHFEELESYFQFISNVTLHHTERLQPIYTISGDSDMGEKVHPFKGYLGNVPVRTGNAAYTHFQNDVYGQVLVSLLPLYTDKRFVDMERHRSSGVILQLLKMIEKTMDEQDSGLWEFRNIRQRHSYTYLFHWAGSSSALKIFEFIEADKKLRDYAASLKKKSAEMLEQCYDEKRKVYTQALGTRNLDASMLQLITHGYLDANEKRAKQHLHAIEKGLKTKAGLLYRYKHEDDFGVPETAFLVCSFWYIDALAKVGRLDQAIEEFEKLLQYANHLGLFSEDVEPVSGSQWGNFPQTYCHVGLINCAFRISRKLDKPSFL